LLTLAGSNFAQNMKINGVRFSSDDSTLTSNNNLSSYLSTKSFTLINNNLNNPNSNSYSYTPNNGNNPGSNQAIPNNVNRRNSIKESYNRTHK
jgi:hypothetical protein